MPRSKPPYPPEFRREAVELARTSGKPIAQVARDLGVSSQTLHTWIKQADIDVGKREGLSTEEREELRRQDYLDPLQGAGPRWRLPGNLSYLTRSANHWTLGSSQ